MRSVERGRHAEDRLDVALQEVPRVRMDSDALSCAIFPQIASDFIRRGMI